MTDFNTMLKQYCKDPFKNPFTEVRIMKKGAPKFSLSLEQPPEMNVMETYYLWQIRQYYAVGGRPIYGGYYSKAFKEWVKNAEFKG